MSNRYVAHGEQSYIRVVRPFPSSFPVPTPMPSTLSNWNKNHQWPPNYLTGRLNFYFFSYLTAMVLHYDHCPFPWSSGQHYLQDVSLPLWLQCHSFTCCPQRFLFCKCHSLGFYLWHSFYQTYNLNHDFNGSQISPDVPHVFRTDTAHNNLPLIYPKLKSIFKNRATTPPQKKKKLPITLVHGITILAIS